MTNPEVKKEKIAVSIPLIAKVYAYIVEDFAKHLLGFVPNGLNLIYDFVFKSLPLIGGFFAHRWVEQVLKLCTGITIGQGLAGDLAYYIFRPIGFVLGLIVGGFYSKVPQYQGQIGKSLYRFSAQVVGGAIIAIGGLLIASQFSSKLIVNVENLIFALATGAVIGLLSKGVLLFAINSVNNANAAAARKNVQKAKELNTKLKAAARQKAKSIILIQAQDIVLQMNGPQSASLEAFFEQEYDNFAAKLYQKLDRHFNYLADRACHGDISALKRLQDLVPKKGPTNAKAPFEVLVERMFNARAIFKLKDDVDTAYDRWQYRYLKVAEL